MNNNLYTSWRDASGTTKEIVVMPVENPKEEVVQPSQTEETKKKLAELDQLEQAKRNGNLIYLMKKNMGIILMIVGGIIIVNAIANMATGKKTS